MYSLWSISCKLICLFSIDHFFLSVKYCAVVTNAWNIRKPHRVTDIAKKNHLNKTSASWYSRCKPCEIPMQIEKHPHCESESICPMPFSCCLFGAVNKYNDPLMTKRKQIIETLEITCHGSLKYDRDNILEELSLEVFLWCLCLVFYIFILSLIGVRTAANGFKWLKYLTRALHDHPYQVQIRLGNNRDAAAWLTQLTKRTEFLNTVF